MLDASIGKFIRPKKGKSPSINLSAQNITNNRNMRTGGYEQNRDDFTRRAWLRHTASRKTRSTTMPMPSMPSLNIGFKF